MTTKERQLRVVLPSDIDHAVHCGRHGDGGLRSAPAVGTSEYQVEITPERDCPGCCYERGYKDAMKRRLQ